MWTFSLLLGGFFGSFFLEPSFFRGKRPAAILANSPPENNIFMLSGAVNMSVFAFAVWTGHLTPPTISKKRL